MFDNAPFPPNPPSPLSTSNLRPPPRTDVRHDSPPSHPNGALRASNPLSPIPKEKMPWWRPIYWSVLLLILQIINLQVLALLPPLLLALLFRAFWFSSKSYSRPPSSLNVAVIGAGWTGLQVTGQFKDLGVDSVRCYENMNDVGGTWHKSLAYSGLKIHTPSWMASFAGFPYTKNPPGQKPTKLEIEQRVHNTDLQTYFKKYATHKSINDKFVFNSKITQVSYDSKTKKGHVTIYNSKTKRATEEGPFDAVIFTGYATYPNKPDLPGENDFLANGGQVYHSCNVNDALLASLVSQNKKVIVVGAGKSSCDLVLQFVEQRGLRNLTWLFRRPYQFMRCEKVSKILKHNPPPKH